MDKPQTDTVSSPGPTSIKLDLSDLDLSNLGSLEGTALQAIALELNDQSDDKGQSKHHSHHSYSTHGTAAW
jgi:hypothetical protein